MGQLSFQIAEYDAPLGLILELVAKHKLNILDIDISALLEQYLQTMETWKTQNFDVASEFLEMASRLVYMKTISLLPRHEEESEKLRRDLSGQLMEYQLCKLAAETLNHQNQYSNIFVREPLDIPVDPIYKHVHQASLLYAALVDAMGRGARRMPPSQESFEPLVTRPVVSVTSKIFTVLRILKRERSVPLSQLFDPEMGRSGLVATFLAVLELLKSGGIQLEGDQVILRSQIQQRGEPDGTS